MTEGKAADGAEGTAPRDGESTGAAPATPSKVAPSSKESRTPKDSRSSKDSRDSKDSGAKGKKGAKESIDQVRSTVATIVWVAAVLCALVLAAGALVVALDFNARNDVVKFLTDTAENINFLGDLKTFEPDGRSRDAVQSARTKEVLVNWGICAVVYLVVGKVADRLIRP